MEDKSIEFSLHGFFMHEGCREGKFGSMCAGLGVAIKLCQES